MRDVSSCSSAYSNVAAASAPAVAIAAILSKLGTLEEV